MYFSLITPADGQERDAAHARLHGPYADHQWLWQWFPAPAGTPRDFLFRSDARSDAPLRFHVVSQRPPTPTPGPWQVQTREYRPQLSAGQQLQFELRANPTVRHGHDGKSKRHDVLINAKKRLLAERGLARWQDLPPEGRPSFNELAVPACTQWLARRGQALGFELMADTLEVQGKEQHEERADRKLQFTTVDLAGLLVVKDPQAFERALMHGVGSAKAFGCGLLLVKRLG